MARLTYMNGAKLRDQLDFRKRTECREDIEHPLPSPQGVCKVRRSFIIIFKIDNLKNCTDL